MKNTRKTNKMKYLISIIITIIAIALIPKNSFAEIQKYNATTTENGVNINWEYQLNDSNQIIELKCTNPNNLTGNITIPNELDGKVVVEIGSEALKSGSNITKITIPDSIKEIGYKAFENCTNLENINLGKIESLSFGLFTGCTKLKSITIPNTVKDGSVEPVLNNRNITNITFEDGLTIIPTYLCANTGISSITIPSSVKEISYDAFENCPNLENVDLGKIEKITFDVFKDCPKLKSITIPSTLRDGTTVDKGVFTGTTHLTSVTFENGAIRIPDGILQGCDGITEITIPETVTEIGEYAFKGTSITEITIPNSVEGIEHSAFEDCTKLKKITILDNCEKIGWFTIYPNQDTVFENHDEDLTIYCYEGSKIAEYAINNNIKYVYLKRSEPASSGTEEEKNNQSGNQQNKEQIKQLSGEDVTTAKKEIPQTGQVGIVVALLATIGLGTIVYIKYRNLKNII